MGQRGAKAAFMPSKFVFPGGAVDPDDATIALAGDPPDLAALAEGADPVLARALCVAAIRETFEETGLILGKRSSWSDAPPACSPFAGTGHRPDGGALRFVFRAITPPGRPRRFDARFFMAPASAISGEPDDFSRSSGELSALQWVPLSEARALDMPFITEVVLAELAAILSGRSQTSVPFFYNDAEESLFLRLHGRLPAADQ